MPVVDPRIDCAKVTKQQCRSRLWQPILMEDCPNACGFCTTSDCKDLAPDCHSDPGICSRKGMEDFVEKYCQRTCQLCTKKESEGPKQLE
ncbi:shTK domain protein [Ancylostoma ceylanicum]|uniref:ShTK domain protein n=1 Tax=Ancylostoma ceylanicum TaxID=53326 RepID=A0A0D6LV66_9BILA|nr:shTK domain protein [Ancylostoma ceylanicum]